ncbi:MAG: GTPase ObgE [Candidatus Gracilibacteria bacterium]|nr:GTPase ObgE [Candidatus Gracilibacteria bacterium]
MFIDEVKLKVIAGKGGNGIVSWRREKYIPKGGPRGGNGGNGGNVYLQTNQNLNTLSFFRHKKIFKASNGERGGTQDKNGVGGEDLILEVPVGTIVKDLNSGKVLYDLNKNNQKLLLALGGRGGYGNSHFVSSTRQAPAFAELGDIGEEVDIQLELKLVADIGIIGIPSAGKSTLINTLTNVNAKVGDYPFTTLIPNLGVLEHKDKSLVLEDVPGLIPGASKGKGLGIEFLKHIERTGVLLHIIDLYRLDDAFGDYEDIRKELEYFSEDLAKKEEIIVLAKADLLDKEMVDYILNEFTNKFSNKKIFVISSATYLGLNELKDYLIENYTKDKEEINLDDTNIEEIKLYDLKEQKDPNDYNLRYIGNFTFEIKGERIEQIVRMTDFLNIDGVMRVYDVLEKIQAIKKIEKELAKIYEKENIDNSSFFEGGSDEDIAPKIIIGNKTLKLDKLKYNL